MVCAALSILPSVVRSYERPRRLHPRWRVPSTQSSASRCCAPSCRQLTTPSTWLPLRCKPKSLNASPRSPWCSCCPISCLDSCRSDQPSHPLSQTQHFTAVLHFGGKVEFFSHISTRDGDSQWQRSVFRTEKNSLNQLCPSIHCTQQYLWMSSNLRDLKP